MRSGVDIASDLSGDRRVFVSESANPRQQSEARQIWGQRGDQRSEQGVATQATPSLSVGNPTGSGTVGGRVGEHDLVVQQQQSVNVVQRTDVSMSNVDGDLGSRSASMQSASVLSFREGLPQREPMLFETVEQLTGSMHDLAVGTIQARSGQLRLSLDEPQSSSALYQPMHVDQQQLTQPQVTDQQRLDLLNAIGGSQITMAEMLQTRSELVQTPQQMYVPQQTQQTLLQQSQPQQQPVYVQQQQPLQPQQQLQEQQLSLQQRYDMLREEQQQTALQLQQYQQQEQSALLLQQQQYDNVQQFDAQQQQIIEQQQFELRRFHAALQLQEGLSGTSGATSSTPHSGVDPLFGATAHIQQHVPLSGQQQQQQQYQQSASSYYYPPVPPSGPLGEAGGAGYSGATGGPGGGGNPGGNPGGGGGGAGLGGPTLSPQFVKIDRPQRFNGKHAELENFLFSMDSYITSCGLRGQAATMFLVSYLTGDALTWWRQYSQKHGGLHSANSVHTQIDMDILMEELRGQFTDINKALTIRQRLFSIKQRTSVQAFTTLFRHLQCELGSKAVDDDTAMHLYLYGLKGIVQSQVMLHLPDTFEDLVRLAERADQAFMATRENQPNQQGNNRNQQQRGGYQNNNQNRGNQNRGNWSPNNQRSGGNAQGGARGGYSGGSNSGNVNWNQASQYNNLGYRGPAPMVLGACYQCGQQGHIKRDCPQLSNRGRGGNSPRGGNGPRGRPGGQPRDQANMAIDMLVDNGVEVSDALHSMLHLGAAALENQQHQRELHQNVQFNETAEYSDGSRQQTKN